MQERASDLVSEVVARFKRNAGGNKKLGDMFAWSLPPRDTCPGKTEICSRLCYVDQFTVRYPNTIISYRRSLKISKRKDFRDILIQALARLPEALMRIHVSGDFYSVRYTEAWFEALKANPHIKPFAFTRSWRVPEILAVFKEYGNPSWLFASSDPETGEVPEGFREAKMLSDSLKEIRKGLLPRPRLICDEQIDPKNKSCSSCGRCPTFKIGESGLIQLPKAVIRNGVNFAQH